VLESGINGLIVLVLAAMGLFISFCCFVVGICVAIYSLTLI